jgi:hypothetical protein
VCLIRLKALCASEETNGALRPLITTSELVVGQNQFAFGLLRANDRETQFS